MEAEREKGELWGGHNKYGKIKASGRERRLDYKPSFVHWRREKNPSFGVWLSVTP